MEKEKTPEVEVVEAMPQEPAKKSKKGKVKKILEWIFTGIFGVLLVSLATIQIAKWTNKDGFIFNYMFPEVLTESMENHENPDDGYKVGEVIIVKKTDVTALKVGDDITFYYKFPEFKEEVKCTHRIIEIAENTDESKDYKYTFVCQGINKDSPKWRDQKQYVHEDKVLGKVVGKSPFIAFIYKVFSSVWSLIVLILIPSMYLVISAILDLFKKYNLDEEPEGALDKPKKPTNNGPSRLEGMSKEEKERLKKQMLDEMLNRKKGK